MMVVQNLLLVAISSPEFVMMQFPQQLHHFLMKLSSVMTADGCCSSSSQGYSLDFAAIDLLLIDGSTATSRAVLKCEQFA